VCLKIKIASKIVVTVEFTFCNSKSHRTESTIRVPKKWRQGDDLRAAGFQAIWSEMTTKLNSIHPSQKSERMLDVDRSCAAPRLWGLRETKAENMVGAEVGMIPS
jgi:hypothetical protein